MKTCQVCGNTQYQNALYGDGATWRCYDCIDRSKPQAVPANRPTGGIALIANERHRQIEKEGYTPEHDDSHDKGELIKACDAYLNIALYQIANNGLISAGCRYVSRQRWPWSEDSFEPSDDTIENLTKAAALIAAEIDRLQRLTPTE